MNFDERRVRIRFLTPWIRECRATLWLNHHEMRIHHERPENADCQASIFRPHNRVFFALWLGDDFLTDEPEGQRLTLTHELLHIWFGPLWDVIRAIESQVGQPAYRVWSEALESAEERSVDQFAWAIAPLLSLPPVWPGPAESKGEGE